MKGVKTLSILLTLLTVVLVATASLYHKKTTSHSALHKYVYNNADEEVTHPWLTIEQALDSVKIKPRKIFVEIYTDWCHVCKMLDRKTLSKPTITNNLLKNYYSVKLNAESTGTIRFGDSVYTFNPNLGRGIHNLALHLGKEAGTVSYPTLVILDENLNVLYRYAAYITVSNLEEVLDLYR